ncbi:MAG: hypothetical protein LBJ00_03440, partial [Planctomycetaceae bacterium]|nr:hypothetical protein [Planctomycetaceae bacterium]
FRQFGKLLTVFIIAILVLNLFYNFNGTFRPLKNYTFVSQPFTGQANDPQKKNRFADSWIGVVPVPLPQDYLYGIDVQKYDFERGIPSYKNGTWSEHGYWYYYFYAFFLKTPIGFQILLLASVFLFLFHKQYQFTFLNESVLLIPFLLILVLISSQDGFSIHSRYLLPILPFLFVWTSRIGIIFESNENKTRFPYPRILSKVSVTILTCWMIVSVLLVFPHCMSYFNEFVGGAVNGGKYLLGSDLDWGQDVYYLEKWQRQHSDFRPLKVSLFGTMPLENTKIKYDGNVPQEGGSTNIYATLKPGWYAVNVNNIFNRKNEYAFLRNEKTIGRAGYSINIYYFSKERIDALRKENHLPSLVDEESMLNQFANELIENCKNNDLTKMKIAIYHDKGVTEGSRNAVAEILNRHQCCCESINVEEIRQGKLINYHVFIVPGGLSNEMAEAIGRDGKEAIRDFVQTGGGYVGICAGAFLASSTFERFLGLVNVKTNHSQELSPRLGMLEQRQLGSGQAEIEYSFNGKQLFSQLNKGHLNYINGPIFIEAGIKELPDFLTLATYLSDIYQHHFQQGTMPKTPAIVAGSFGKGHVILFSPHPELTEGGGAILINAILAVQRDTNEK